MTEFKRHRDGWNRFAIFDCPKGLAIRVHKSRRERVAKRRHNAALHGGSRRPRARSRSRSVSKTRTTSSPERPMPLGSRSSESEADDEHVDVVIGSGSSLRRTRTLSMILNRTLVQGY